MNQRISNIVSKLLNHELNDKQKQIIINSTKQVANTRLTNNQVLLIALKIYNQINIAQNTLPKHLPMKPEPDNEFDIKDMLKKIILKDFKTQPNTKTTSSIVNIFNHTTVKDLVGIFNPKLLYKKAYLTLDSKYAQFLDSSTKLRWDYLNTRIESPNSVNSYLEIKNIVSIKIYSIVIPKFVSTMNRASILIDEFSSQSFIAPNGRKFHTINILNDLEFGPSNVPSILGLTSVGITPDVTTHDKYELLADYRFNEGNFHFYKPITYFNSLTLSFGDPFNVIKMRKYQIKHCTFDSIKYGAFGNPLGYPTYGWSGSFKLNCHEPHFIPLSREIYSLKISNYTTDQPVQDADIIKYINTMEFTSARAISQTTIEIYPQEVRPPGAGPKYVQFIGNGLPNQPLGVSSDFTITFEGYRIIANIEFTYLGS